MRSIGKPDKTALRPADSTGRDPECTLFAIAAFLLAALLVPSLWGMAGSTLQEYGGDPGAGREQKTALAQWEALWSELETRGETALQPELTDPSLRSAGDTAFMRYRNLWREVADPARQAFQMAALSNDPQQKISLLQPLTVHADPRIRFRALLEIARVHLRFRALDAARTAAREALVIPDLPAPILADAYFVLGVAALEAQDFDGAEAALGRAVVGDPGFWDARQMQLLVLGHQIGQPRQSAATCLNRTRLMIENLGALPALAQDRTQFRDIADRFAVQDAAANPALVLLSGLGYRWAGDRERARAALAGIDSTRGLLPPACAARVIAKAEEWLAERF